MTWQTVIGLEVHAQLSTKSKLFSNAPTQYGAPPNTQANYIDAGFPGVLPVLNQIAVQMAIQFGLAIDATIHNHTYFERKNYFYPDLPKGYQISQVQRPIVQHGHLDIILPDGRQKTIHIDRAHLEEDAGKSLHEAHTQYTGIDLNRAGTPLLEIVTTPCLYSAEEVVCYLKTLHQLLRFLNICDGNMQEGSFRCDVNISLRPHDQAPLGTRSELKNINSFRFIEKAIQFEQLRHQDILESGQEIIQETRLYNADKNTTEPMRSKENENDYRYFPDPDLLPVLIDAPLLHQIQTRMPLLPSEIAKRLRAQDALNEEQIEFILSAPEIFHFYEAVQQKTSASTKIIVNWLKGNYAAALNERGLSFENPPISPETLACLFERLSDNTLNNTTAKKVFQQLLITNLSVDEIIKAEGLEPTKDTTALEQIIQEIITKFPEQAAEYRAGKVKLLSFFVGQVMKETKGQADASVINALLSRYL